MNSKALEFELGAGVTEAPFYYNLSKNEYPDQYDDKFIGKVGLAHTFKLPEGGGIKIWATHYSLFRYKEPKGSGAGLNMLGASVEVKLF